MSNKNNFVIDCDVDPCVLAGWSVVSHKKGGPLKLIPERILLYVTEAQKLGCWGAEVLKELTERPVLNANVMDFLLQNQELIPAVWRVRAPLFWGTIYGDPHGNQYIRTLMWSRALGAWSDFFLPIDSYFRDTAPAALYEEQLN